MMRHPPRSPLFPNTPLSRSVVRGDDLGGKVGRAPAVHDPADGERLRLLRELLPGEEGVAGVTVAGREERVRGDDAREIGRAHSELQSQSNLVCRLLLETKIT